VHTFYFLIEHSILRSLHRRVKSLKKEVINYVWIRSSHNWARDLLSLCFKWVLKLLISLEKCFLEITRRLTCPHSFKESRKHGASAIYSKAFSFFNTVWDSFCNAVIKFKPRYAFNAIKQNLNDKQEWMSISYFMLTVTVVFIHLLLQNYGIRKVVKWSRRNTSYCHIYTACQCTILLKSETKYYYAELPESWHGSTLSFTNLNF